MKENRIEQRPTSWVVFALCKQCNAAVAATGGSGTDIEDKLQEGRDKVWKQARVHIRERGHRIYMKEKITK